MQIRPENWAAVFAAPHITEYKFVINGIPYLATDIQGTPAISKPLMQEPRIGRCCDGTLTLTIRQHAGETIPKAASVKAYCRLKTRTGETVTEWIDKGSYWISHRSGHGGLVSLTCRDGMILAGQTYLDKTAFTEWPVAMTDVFDEIASLMGVAIDERTHIKTGAMYTVDYPNEDVLMSEILSSIAAAHGGNFVMSDAGKLWLVPYPDTENPVQVVGDSYSRYTPLSTGVKTISRVTLTDSADNQFTYGDDSGIELAAVCEYATQATVEWMSRGYALDNGVLMIPNGTLKHGVLTTVDGGYSDNGQLVLPGNSALIGRSFTPYELTSVYLDPLVELGDTISVNRKGVELYLVVGTMEIRCNPSFVCDLQNGVADDDEDEIPFIRAKDLEAQRYISTTKSYFGNRLNRTEGFVSELMENDEPVARMVANANRFSMQRMVNGTWEDCLYFDPVARTYKFTGEVEISTLTEVSAASLTGTSLVFAADASGNTFARSYVSSVFAYTGSQKVTPVVSSVTGAVDGMTVSVGSAVDKQIPITISVPSGVNLGSTDSTSGTLIVNVTSPTTIALEINWCKVNTGVAGADGKDGQDGAPGKDGADGTPGKDGEPGKDGQDGAPGKDGEPGKDGQDGAPGKDGADGVTYYTWVKYADTPTSGMSDSPDGKKYIGIAYNKETPEKSTNYEDYAWSLIKGADGASGYNSAVLQVFQRISPNAIQSNGVLFLASGNYSSDVLSIGSDIGALNNGTLELFEIPHIVNQTSYTFSKDMLDGDIGGWERSIPAGSQPCYMFSTAVNSVYDVMQIPATAWSMLMLYDESFSATDNHSFAYLYKRAKDEPVPPESDTLYTFSTESVTGELDGWSQSIPAPDGNACWVICTQVFAATATATIPSSAWSLPGKLVEHVESGASTYCQPDAPTNGKAQDLWIDSDDNYKLYRHDGTGWVSVQDLNIPDIIRQLAAAQTSLKVLNESVEAKAEATYVTNQIDSLVETFNSALTLKADELTASFEGTAQNAAGEVDQKFSTLIRASGDGVEIGKSDSDFRVLLSNNRLSFRQIVGSTTVEVAYMSDRKLFITDAQITNELAFGPNGGNRFVWTKTSKGLSLRYISAAGATTVTA